MAPTRLLRPRVVLLFVVLAATLQLVAQTNQSTTHQSIFQELQRYDPLVITLETDLSAIQDEPDSIARWHKGVLLVMQADTIAHRYNVSVKARGNMRRKYCEFPPLKLRFNPEIPGDTLEDSDDLKLVSACNENGESAQLVQREALMYRLYNQLTDQSFQIQTARLSVKNTGKRQKTIERPAFFIESAAEVAQRLDMSPYNPRVISSRSLDSVSYDRMCIFQYMIGNTDWSLRSKHNMRMFKPEDGLPIAVPYDFDYSGAVDASYAVAHERIPIKNVRERYYMGRCRSEDVIQQRLVEFRQKKAAIVSQCDTMPELEKNDRRAVRQYLESFFELINNPNQVKQNMVDVCEGQKK
ncbi:MAG: hypothetical protein IT270_17590 [Saprospiraceae bacterium]|nr:hypothetical protein [Saprospiraceae bacterium]